MDTPAALDHLRVLDLSGVTGQYCGKLMADLGADVVMVEPPGGSPVRHMQPYANDIVDAERSLFHLNYNQNKRSVIIDIEDAAGRTELEKLVAAADVVIETFSPGYLDSLGLGFDRLREINPRVILTSITSFGQDGPLSGWKGSELISQAMGGLLYPWGDPDQRPAMMPQEQGSQLAAQHGAFATMAAIRHRRTTGVGQHIDISLQEVVAGILLTFGRYAARQETLHRIGAVTNLAPTNLYECKDGFAFLMPGMPRHWTALAEWLDNPILKEEIWQDRDFRRENFDLLDMYVSELAAQFTKEEFSNEAQSRHIPAAPMMTVEDLARDPQLQGRDYFIKANHPVVGEYETPGRPYIWTETPWKVRRPAPLLGEHQDAVKAEWQAATAAAEPARGTNGGSLPLEGLRVLDFGRVWAGPFLTRYLGEMGAEVIKIETNLLPDRAQGTAGAFNFNFSEINRSKQSVTLNTTSPEGVKIFEDLVRNSDVIVDNFRAGVMDNWGLTYERLQEINPRIIALTMPGFGKTGPYVSYLSYGQTLLTFTGLMYLWGHAESPERTRPKGAFPDFSAAAQGAFAILAAVENRERTGRGQQIEMAQVEGLTATLGEAFLDYFINGRVRQPHGNFNPNVAPHDVFPSQGDDAWVAIACYSDEEWRSLCGVAGEDLAWTQDARFATTEGRLENLVDLNAAIGSWTAQFTNRQIMLMLQKADVPAGIAATAEDMYFDYHMRERGYIVTVDHGKDFGVLEQPGATVRFSEAPVPAIAPVPDMGQHNQAVFGDLLGMSKEEIQRLVNEKVLY